MDCYFHSNVPSIAPCGDCGKPICATCRDTAGNCPSCRLSAKIEQATGTKPPLGGQVPPRPEPPPFRDQFRQQAQPGPFATVRQAQVAEPEDPIESRALVALGFPLWPLALLSLFDRKQSRHMRRQAIKALAYNVAFAGLYGVFALFTNFVNIPILSGAPEILSALLLPIFLVGSVYFGIKTWNGEDVRIPILSDWIDDRIPA